MVKSNKYFILIRVFCSGLFALIILSFFSLIYNTSGIAIRNPATGWSHKPNSIVSNFSEGFAFFRNDGNGYNNQSIMTPGNIDYLVMGSSHMESTQVSQKNNYTYLLNGKLGNVYNIGIAGAFLTESLANFNNAVDIFQPKKGVIIEIPSVIDDIEKLRSLNAGKWDYYDIKYDTKLIRFIKEYICFVPCLFHRIEAWIEQSYMHKEEYNNDGTMAEYWTLVDASIERIVNHKPEGVDIFFLIHPNIEISEFGTLLPIKDQNKIVIFKQICNKYGVEVIDPVSKFINLYNIYHKFPTGFSNSAIGYGHLNVYGHRLCAEETLETIALNKNIVV